jgi:long-subunit acyl-CoA synthetase (AMP-forming)
VTLGYGSIHTLTDSSVRECKGDIKELRPTLMTGVPAVWQTIRKGVLASVSKGSPLFQSVFGAAFSAKAWCQDRKLNALTGIFDAMVFVKVRQETGGRLQYALSGGAPISREAQRFLTTLCPVLQAYGMTEVRYVCYHDPRLLQLQSCGLPSFMHRSQVGWVCPRQVTWPPIHLSLAVKSGSEDPPSHLVTLRTKRRHQAH